MTGIEIAQLALGAVQVLIGVGALYYAWKTGRAKDDKEKP